MRMPDANICVTIPTLNEEAATQTVIKGIPFRFHDKSIFIVAAAKLEINHDE